MVISARGFHVNHSYVIFTLVLEFLCLLSMVVPRTYRNLTYKLYHYSVYH